MRSATNSDCRSIARSRAELRANLLLLLVALVWGSAFVAQRLGMEHAGPFVFNAARFAIGALTLVPVLGWRRLRAVPRSELDHGAVLGALLFVAASLQQIGLIWTSAGQAGFITGLYVVLVPLLLALVWRQRTGWETWLGAGLAAVGLFLLSVRPGLRWAAGHGWVLGSAVVWALHVIAIGYLAPTHDPLRLALIQFAVCSLLSLPMALILERGARSDLLMAAPALAYAGLLSIGLGYTGQIVAQQQAQASHAAIILSLESAFAALFGWAVLGESLSLPQMVGCALMLVGMLLTQLSSLRSHS